MCHWSLLSSVRGDCHEQNVLLIYRPGWRGGRRDIGAPEKFGFPALPFPPLF
jgi:hypothetical protein